MFRIIQGASVLLLLSAFFAYVLVPIVDGVRLRTRFGRRQRPLPIWAVLAVLYLVIFSAASLVWLASASRIRNVITVSAPAAIDRLFSGDGLGPVDKVLARIPGPTSFHNGIAGIANRGTAYLEWEVRSTFDDLLGASRYGAWLAVVPFVTFFLITAAPGFRRSADRLLPHGHLQWRAGEYFRDVNSALAGYVRAQLAAAVLVGAVCSLGFALLRLPYALALGIVAGALELLPAIGPLTALLMASSQADGAAIGVVAFLGGLRVLQDYVIYPRLIRHGMHLATPVVVLAMWFGAALAGAAGVILAMPVAGLLSVSLRHWQEYRAIERVVSDHARKSGWSRRH